MCCPQERMRPSPPLAAALSTHSMCCGCCSDALFEQLQEALVPRLQDKVPGVRVEAVKAVSRLQDPGDAEDPVATEFVRMLGSDTSKCVPCGG